MYISRIKSFAMKKHLTILLFVISLFSAKAQYFEWNKTFFINAISNHPDQVDFTKYLVSGNGSQIISFTAKTCLVCFRGFEYLLDSNGNIVFSNSSIFNFPNNLFFDRNNHLIERVNDSTLTYHLPVSVTFNVNVNPAFIDADTSNNLYLFWQSISG